MASQGIEHRDPDTVMQAFDYFDKPNFAIYVGKDQRTAYEGSSVEDAAAKLREYLEMLAASGTATVYTMKVYQEGQTNIGSKTEHCGSTTFMFSPTAPVRTENGVTFIDRIGAPTAPARGNGDIMAMFTQMMAQQEKFMQQMMAMQQQQQQTKLDKFIGFVEENMNKQQLEPVKDVFDKIGDIVEKNPHVVKDIFTGMSNLICSIIPGKVPTPIDTPMISGTEKFTAAAPAAPAAPADPHTDFHTQQISQMNQHQQQQVAPVAQHQEELTDEQLEALAERDDASLDKLDEWIGPVQLTAMLEQLTAGGPESFEVWVHQQNYLATLNNKLGPADMLKALQGLAGKNTLQLKALLAMM